MGSFDDVGGVAARVGIAIAETLSHLQKSLP